MIRSKYASAPREHPKRPNVLFIMSDDHAATAIGAYGSRLAPLNPTPTIDSLAQKGMLFENCFCTNSVCAPSRATIITGHYSQKNSVLTLGSKLPPEKQYLPKLMREAGYITGIVGKWHLKLEPAQFDYYKVLPGQGDYLNPVFQEKGKGAFPDNEVKEEGHSTDIITDSALDWLKSRDTSKPFFFCLHFKAPHGPWTHHPRYKDYLKDIEIPYPESLFERGNHGSIATRGHNDELIRYIGSSVGNRNPLRNQVQKKLKIRNLSDKEILKESYQYYLKCYLRCVKGIDDNIKRVLDYLKQEEVLDDTIIIYTSDQGMWLGEHDYIDKRWMYEESLRMPFIVRYPEAISPGTRTDTIINNTDFAPTILDFAGVSTPNHMHGCSFRSILETGEEPADWRKATYYRYWMHLASHYNPAHFGIRTKNYKLIFFYGSDFRDKPHVRTPPGWELYDLEKDPEELNNVYGKPEYANVVKELKATLIELREEFDETDQDYPQIQEIIDRHWEDSKESHEEAIRISHEAKAYFDNNIEKIITRKKKR